MWLGGICLSYLGEAGNILALSYVSAAVVAPLGIFSVLTNLYLAQTFLGEYMSDEQKNGYYLVLMGVFGILLCAPKTSPMSPWGASIDDVVSAFFTFRFLVPVVVILVSQSFVLFRIFIQKSHRIMMYVISSALFTTMSITCIKLISVVHHVASLPAPVLNSTSIANLNSTVTNDTIVSDAVLQPSTQSTGISTKNPVIALTVVIMVSSISQELVKQQAYARFPISRFTTMMYAVLNGCVVLSSVIIFQEIHNFVGMLFFLCVFGVCMYSIAVGLSTVQDGNGDIDTEVIFPLDKQ